MDPKQLPELFSGFSLLGTYDRRRPGFLLDNIRELHYPAGAAIQSEERQCLGTLFLLNGRSSAV